MKMDMLRGIGKQSGESVQSVARDFVNNIGLNNIPV